MLHVVNLEGSRCIKHTIRMVQSMLSSFPPLPSSFFVSFPFVPRLQVSRNPCCQHFPHIRIVFPFPLFIYFPIFFSSFYELLVVLGVSYFVSIFIFKVSGVGVGITFHLKYSYNLWVMAKIFKKLCTFHQKYSYNLWVMAKNFKKNCELLQFPKTDVAWALSLFLSGRGGVVLFFVTSALLTPNSMGRVWK